ncbi:MAG: 6-carboxytetrahydropterin synthase [Candidatus Eremiobacteraeota bacterium]|nr:6-carboxytetrahydropterin synthase [Candidatus Eremiobacteraeota bacterium]
MRVRYLCHFDAAHQLDVPYESACNRRHGHRYRVEVEAAATTLRHGMVVDYNVLKRVIEEFDHCDLNERAEFKDGKLQTTAENICLVLAAKLQSAVGRRVRIEEVTVRETPRTAARWERRYLRGRG